MTRTLNDLTNNVVAFARQLRRDGLLIGSDEISLGLQACETVGLHRRDDARAALRAVFASSPYELARFERRFEEYFGRNAPLHEARLPEPPHPPSDAQPHLGEWGTMSSDADHEQATAIYSPSEARIERDIASFSNDEMVKVERHVRRLTRRLATRLSRRERHAQRGSQLDLRRSIRASLRHGGELIDLDRQRRDVRKTSVTLLLDVSGSMDLYQRFLIQLAQAFVAALGARRVEAFAFSTELIRLTPVLRAQAGHRGVDTFAPLRSSPNGTRIGQSLRAFLDRHGESLDRHTHVVIASDGWDVGDLATLDQAMAELSRRSATIVWLNPLAGRPDYEPSAAGMAMARPYINILAPGHNLASLRVLEHHLLQN